MSRLAALLIFRLALVPLQAASPVLTLQNELLPSPAPVGAHAPQFMLNNERLLLTWKTTGNQNNPAAIFNQVARRWENVATSVCTNSTPVQQQTIACEFVVNKAERSAKVWFDYNPKDPSIQLSFKPGPQEYFLMPVRVENDRPNGAPDLVLLADGTVFVSWPEHYSQNETALWLRRVSPGGLLSVPVLLAVIPECQPNLHLALVKDFDDKPAQLLLAYTIGQGETSQIATRLLTIDPATDAAHRNPCVTCPDPDESARGYALRGHVVSFSTEKSTLTLQHSEIAGVLPAGKTTFKVDPALLESSAPSKELFARVEKRANDWWLFAASWVVRAEP